MLNSGRSQQTSLVVSLPLLTAAASDDDDDAAPYIYVHMAPPKVCYHSLCLRFYDNGNNETTRQNLIEQALQSFGFQVLSRNWFKSYTKPNENKP